MSNLSDRGTLRGTLQRNSGNYNDLINKPAINGHTLIGNQSGHALGLANEDDIIYVEANPLGPATADLHKILVDDTIYSIPDVVVYGTASGAIASFDDGGNNKPLKSLKVAINPVQDLHGYDHPWPAGGGKNKLNLATRAQGVTQGITSEVKNDNTVLASGTSTGNGDITCTVSSPFTMTAGNTYTLSINGTDTRTGSVAVFLGTSYTNAGAITINAHSLTVTPSSDINCNQVMFRISNGRSITMNARIQIEAGSTATTYAPYSNICPISGWDEAEIHRADGATPHIIDDTYNITWSEAGTVYGGELDVTSGVLTVTHANIASYNGESINEPWISSEDAYESGATPTTGAQVVYPLTTPITVQLTPIPITSLLGNNNIWSDTGEITECVYQRDINIALNKALNQ